MARREHGTSFDELVNAAREAEAARQSDAARRQRAADVTSRYVRSRSVRAGLSAPLPPSHLQEQLHESGRRVAEGALRKPLPQNGLMPISGEKPIQSGWIIDTDSAFRTVYQPTPAPYDAGTGEWIYGGVMPIEKRTDVRAHFITGKLLLPGGRLNSVDSGWVPVESQPGDITTAAGRVSILSSFVESVRTVEVWNTDELLSMQRTLAVFVAQHELDV